MIDIKQAITAAKEFAAHAYEQQSSDFQLEEIQRSEDRKFWLVTVGFLRELPPVNKLAAALGGNSIRVYKVIKINALTGEALAMQMREEAYADA